MRLASHVLRVKNVVFKGQVFVVWIDIPAIETCILVEIDLQVCIFARKVGFTGPKVYLFSYFAVCWMGRVDHVGTRRFSWRRELCVFLLGNAIRSHFFLRNAGVTIFFFNGTVACCKKPSYFFLSFIFWQSLRYFLYFFHLFICV